MGLWLFLWLLWTVGAASARAASLNPIQYVVHISVDGLGGVYLQDYLTETPGDFPAFSRLKSEGAGTFNARCDYHVSVTEPNHTTILTGRPVLQQPVRVPFSAPHGYANNYDPGPPWTLHTLGNLDVPYKASVFDVVHDHGLATAFYGGKDKFELFVRSYDADNGAADEIGDDNGRNKIDAWAIIDFDSPFTANVNSSNLVTLVVEALADAPPQYTFLHIADADVFGHYYYWGSDMYRECIQHVDRQLARILAAIEANPVLSNHTAIVLTADHGGGDSYYSHVLPYERPVYTIPLLVWGPGVPAGVNLYQLFSSRLEPGTSYLDYDAPWQPLRNGDSANIALALLGLPSIPGSCLQPAFGPPPVFLSITSSAAGLAVSWPVTAESYDLQWAETCNAPVWQTVTDHLVSDGQITTYTFACPPDAPRRFFRLAIYEVSQ